LALDVAQVAQGSHETGWATRTCWARSTHRFE
jgi:hypothetical protein